MKYAKLNGPYLQPAPRRVAYNGKQIFNPPGDILQALGYYPVTYTDPPDDAQAGQHYESSWSQTDTEILQVWSLVDDPVVPDAEPTMADLEMAIKEAINSDN